MIGEKDIEREAAVFGIKDIEREATVFGEETILKQETTLSPWKARTRKAKAIWQAANDEVRQRTGIIEIQKAFPLAATQNGTAVPRAGSSSLPALEEQSRPLVRSA
ncbi:hypothetical protein [Paenibacillus ginsengihumi]|uniref:hypothetical protein n=1 Tax=Paenibacillus ginsengihumi TaxID=431596 RepID=UPI000360340F|nr:hypothetical protein [Paenibacillus ginsengihumi]